MMIDARIQAHSVTFKKRFIHLPAIAPVQPLLSPGSLKIHIRKVCRDHWISDQTLSVPQRLDKTE